MTTRSAADQIIADLLEWAEQTGGWEAPVWQRAHKHIYAMRWRENLAFDLWDFIENVTDEDPTRQDQFFKLRERVREMQTEGSVVR